MSPDRAAVPPEQTSLALFNRDYVTDKVEAFIGINADGLTIGHVFPSYNQSYFPGSFNYFVPGSIELVDRVVAFGEVTYRA